MSRPFNVLELRDTDEIGGPGKTILETARAIDRQRFRVHLGVFQARSENGGSPFIAAAQKCGMPVHLIRGYNQYDPRLISRTASLVRRLDIDIVHAHEVKSDVIGLLASRLHRVRTVTTLHGWIGNSRKQRAFIALDRQVVRAFDLVIAVSRPIMREALEAGVTEGRLQLLNNGIVVANYRRSTARGALERMLGRSPRGPVLAAVGRLSAEKGHADLLEALGILARSGRHFETVLVGDGAERGRLTERARQLGLADWVYFPGYLGEPQTVLNESDLLVLPSHTEGLPNAALEALAMDVPVLATAVGGTPEVIIDGQTGRAVPAKDPEAMSRALGDFLADRTSWTAMAARGRQHVEQHFDFLTRTRRLEELYTMLVERTRQ